MLNSHSACYSSPSPAVVPSVFPTVSRYLTSTPTCAPVSSPLMSTPAYIYMSLSPQVDICRKSTGVFTHVTESVCYTLSLYPTFLFVTVCSDLLPAENINTANLLVAWDINLSPSPESFTCPCVPLHPLPLRRLTGQLHEVRDGALR